MNKLALAACVVTLLSVAPALSQNAPPGNPTNTGFMAQQPGDRLASRLVGLNIQNTGNENIGEIYDIILTDAGAVKVTSSAWADFSAWVRDTSPLIPKP
jgi:hypothetical protein